MLPRLPTETVALCNLRNERTDAGTGIQERVSRGALMDLTCQCCTDIHWYDPDDDRFFYARPWHRERWCGDSDRTDSHNPRKGTRVNLANRVGCDNHRDRVGGILAYTQEDE